MVRGRKIGRREFLKRGAAAAAGLVLPRARSVKETRAPAGEGVWQLSGERSRADRVARLFADRARTDVDWGNVMYARVLDCSAHWEGGWIEIGGSDA